MLACRKRELRETKQRLNWWPNLATHGCYLVSLRFLCDILATKHNFNFKNSNNKIVSWTCHPLHHILQVKRSDSLFISPAPSLSPFSVTPNARKLGLSSKIAGCARKMWTTNNLNSILHRKWREDKQQPKNAWFGDQLCCCLVCLRFICEIQFHSL